MKTTTIYPPQRYGVIVAGGIEAARDAIAQYVGGRPMHNPHINGYGAVHADIWATRDQVEAWFAAINSWPWQPGQLMFYIRKEGLIVWAPAT